MFCRRGACRTALPGRLPRRTARKGRPTSPLYELVKRTTKGGGAFTLHIVILANPQSWYRRDLERAATERGHRVTALPFERLTAHVQSGCSTVWGTETELSKVDAIIVRTMPPGSLEQVVFRMNLLARREAAGVQVVSAPRGMEG